MLVGALHQLVDLRAHRCSRRSAAAPAPRSRPGRPRGSRRRGCRYRAGCGWRSGPARGSARSPRRPKPSSPRRSRARPATTLLGAGAGGHPLGLDAGQGAGAAGGGDGGAVEDVDLLGALAGLRRLHRLRVAGGDRDLGPLAALALAHLLGDVGGQHLGFEGLPEDDLVDRLADDLLEARHVDAGLLRVEVDEALEVGVEEVLDAVGLDPDHLLDAGDSDAREADLGGRQGALDVGERLGWRSTDWPSANQ